MAREKERKTTICTSLCLTFNLFSTLSDIQPTDLMYISLYIFIYLLILLSVLNDCLVSVCFVSFFDGSKLCYSSSVDILLCDLIAFFLLNIDISLLSCLPINNATKPQKDDEILFFFSVCFIQLTSSIHFRSSPFY